MNRNIKRPRSDCGCNSRLESFSVSSISSQQGEPGKSGEKGLLGRQGLRVSTVSSLASSDLHESISQPDSVNSLNRVCLEKMERPVLLDLLALV